MRTHKITYGADAVLPAYPGDTCRVPFTAAEESQADMDDTNEATRQSDRATRATRREELEGQLADGSITHAELIALLNLRDGV